MILASAQARAPTPQKMAASSSAPLSDAKAKEEDDPRRPKILSVARVSAELGYPSAPKLHAELLRRGLRLSLKEVQAFVRRQPERQIFAPRELPGARGRGAITALGVNDRWFGDLVDYTAQPSEPGGERYVLVVQDVWTRRLFARALADKRPATVAAALDQLFAQFGVPNSFETDEGAEFGGPVSALLEKLSVRQARKSPKDRNVHATLDRAIGTLRQTLARVLVAKRHRGLGGRAAWRGPRPQPDAPQLPAGRRGSGRRGGQQGRAVLSYVACRRGAPAQRSAD